MRSVLGGGTVCLPYLDVVGVDRKMHDVLQRAKRKTPAEHRDRLFRPRIEYRSARLVEAIESLTAGLS